MSRRDEIRFGEELVRKLPLARAPETLWSEVERGLSGGPAPERRRARWRGWVAAGAAASVALAAAFVLPRTREPGWEVVRVAGAPLLGSERVLELARIKPGEWLETDALSRARINVGAIGQVAIGPKTKIRVLEGRGREHWLALERGTVRARIWAPPRLFFVETPAATAVDLGCAYVMEVDEAGRGVLRVTSGQVALEHRGRESLVPAGAVCGMRPGVGPGTPCFEDAPEGLRRALARFDFEGGGEQALEAVLAEARPRDTLTLWHLLWRAERPQRDEVFERMAALAGVPRGIERGKVLDLDRHTLELWKNELEWEW